MLTEKFSDQAAAQHGIRKNSTLQYHDILALATSTGPWSAALRVAVDMASRWEANVTGCYVPATVRDYRALENEPTVMSLLTAVDYECPDESAAFHIFAKEHGANHATWAVTHTAIAPTLRKLGAWHDLAIIERDMVDQARVFDILGESMLSSHLPCLLLPPHWDDTVAFNRIVIGWNGNYEDSRALHSALPLLKLANKVVLVNGEVRPPYDNQRNVAEPDPIAYLMHHGIAAKPHYIQVPAEEAGKVLLQKAHEMDADLLVMGAYGHSRIRERVLGGATRHVMANADIPVFMQH
jgi:nucleotide-binding universal stress UspA family protein